MGSSVRLKDDGAVLSSYTKKEKLSVLKERKKCGAFLNIFCC